MAQDPEPPYRRPVGMIAAIIVILSLAFLVLQRCSA
jgi:hypothetical protein